MFADSHVEFIHHQDDLKDTDPLFLHSQISPEAINKIKPELLFLAIWVDPQKNGWKKMIWIIDEYKKTILKNHWTLVKKKNDLKKNGVKIILHIEDLAAIEDDLSKIEELYALGIRSIGLTHNNKNQFAGGSLSDKGLTKLGKKAVAIILNKYMILDQAHLSEKSFFAIQKEFDVRPFISHTGVFSCHPNHRNISDKILKNVRKNGGYVGIGLAGSFLKESEANKEDYLAQIKYASKLAGPENVGIGSDLGGVSSYLPKGIKNLTDLQLLELPNTIKQTNLLDTIKTILK